MQPGMADEKERRLRDARAASVYSMPPRDFYEGVGDDLIAGLQVRCAYAWPHVLRRMCLAACAWPHAFYYSLLVVVVSGGIWIA